MYRYIHTRKCWEKTSNIYINIILDTDFIPCTVNYYCSLFFTSVHRPEICLVISLNTLLLFALVASRTIHGGGGGRPLLVCGLGMCSFSHPSPYLSLNFIITISTVCITYFFLVVCKSNEHLLIIILISRAETFFRLPIGTRRFFCA